MIARTLRKLSITFLYRFKKEDYLLLFLNHFTLRLSGKYKRLLKTIKLRFSRGMSMITQQSLISSIQNSEPNTKLDSSQQTSTPQTVPTKDLQPKVLDLAALEAEAEKATLGQRVADAMATKVGSWGFLIGQTAVLTGWVGMNLTPGMPHWDQSPFILLNLVFSFASAYTAPIVLMSQNRQSDIDRKKTEYDHLVNRKASYDIELLHEKFDTLHSRQLAELTQIIQLQNQQIQDLKNSILPILNMQQQSSDNFTINTSEISILPSMNQCKGVKEIKVADAKTSLPIGKQGNQYSLYFPTEYPLSLENTIEN